MLKSRTCRVSLSIFKDALASVRTFNSSFGDWKRAANVRALEFHGNSPLTSESNSLCFYEVQLSKFDWKDVLHENINETRNAWFGHAFIRRRFATDDGRKLICPLTAHLSRETSWDNTFALSKLARSEMIKSHIKSLIDENGQFSDYCSQEYIPPNQPKPFSHCYLHGQHEMEVNKSGFAGRNELHLKDGGNLRCIAKHWNVHHRQIDFYERTLSFNREAIHMNSSCKIKVSLFSTRATTLLATLRRSETIATLDILQHRAYSSDAPCGSNKPAAPEVRDHSQRAVVTALWCNLLVLMLKCGVWLTTASHVMLAEAVHSLADLANQALLAYGLISSKRAPDALHPYGYSKERFVWSLISAVGIFCLGSGATIVHGVTNLWNAQPIDSMLSAVIVIVGSMVMEGASLVVAVNAVRKGAAAEGMKWQEYVWRGHDPTAVAVMMEDSAAVAGLLIAGIALATVSITGNPIWDPIGSILVGNLLGVVAIFLIQRNRHALLGRSMDTADMQRVMNLLSFDPVVDAVYDCKSEVIGPGAYRFKAEIDFNGVVIVQNYLQRAGREAWMGEFREAVKDPNNSTLERVLAIYGEEVVAALGSEVDRLEKEIQKLVPGIRHVDIEAHNPKGALP